MDWSKPTEGEMITTIDPNRTAFSDRPRELGYIAHPQGPRGKLKYDKHTGTILWDIDDGPRIAHPIELPPEFRDVPQPNVHSCSEPKPGNMGCWAFNGCPMARFRPQPKNVIIEKDGNLDSVWCHQAYTGISPAGRPTSQSMYLNRGWKIVTDRTSVPRRILEPFTDQFGNKTRRTVEVEMEVDNLAPFYADAIAKRDEAKRLAEESEAPVASQIPPAPEGPRLSKNGKRIGRPKKS